MERKTQANRKPKNPWLSKEISRLLNMPTSKWKKNDWVNAAKFLAVPKQKNIIIETILDGVKNELSEHINTVTKKRRGRPEKRLPFTTEKILEIVEARRQTLGQMKKIDSSKITDKAIAMSFAVHEKKANKTTRDSKYQLGRKYQNFIKYMKRKAKTG